MEIVPDNKIIGVFATGVRDTYEADNMLSVVVSDSFRSDDNTVTLYVGVEEGDVFFIAGTNATSVGVSKGSVLDVAWGDSTTWGSLNDVEWVDSDYETLSGILEMASGDGYRDYWVPYTKDSKNHIIKVELSYSEATFIDVKAIFGGTKSEFRDGNLSIVVGLIDKSVRYRLNSGEVLVDKKAGDVLRMFTGSFDAAQSTELITFLNILQKQGSKPMPWRVFSKSVSTGDWVLFGSVVDLTSIRGAIDRPFYSLCSFKVEEVA